MIKTLMSAACKYSRGGPRGGEGGPRGGEGGRGGGEGGGRGGRGGGDGVASSSCFFLFF